MRRIRARPHADPDPAFTAALRWCYEPDRTTRTSAARTYPTRCPY